MLTIFKKSAIPEIIKLLVTTILLLSFTTIFSLQEEQGKLPVISGIGGDFTAVDGNGKTIKFSDYKGKVVVLAFGYTNCADICPFTLGYLKQLYNLLPEEEKKETQVIFVTVDPKYDTPEHLKTFVEFFNKDFIGLSGSQQQIENITSLYQAEYRSLSDDGEIDTKDIRRVTPRKSNDDKEKGSLFSHTVVIYLIDKEGLTRSLEYTGTIKDEFVAKIRKLVNEE